MAEGYLKFSCHTPAAIVLDRFSGVSDPTVWIYQEERYFNFYGFSKDMWLSLPYLYFDGEALAWFNWLYRNKQFYDWKHFTDKLACHYRQRIVTELELPSVTALLLQMDANFTHMRHHLDNIQNTLSACSQKFSDIQAHPDLAASLVDKCDEEEVAEQEMIFALNKVNLNTTEHCEVPYTMLEPHVAKSKVLPKLLNSRGSSSTSIPFPSSVISFGCVETLSPMLDSKNDLDDPSSYESKVFAKMPDKKIDMEVEHPVIYYSGNPASYMFDEMFQTASAVKEGEYSALIMFDNSHLALPCLLSAGNHPHLIGRSIFDYYREFDYTKLLLWLYRFPPDQFGFSFPFDPGSSLLTIFLGAASYDSHMVAADFKEFIRIFTCRIDSTSNAQCILPQFPFDPDANLFIITPGGCLQVSILQREVFNWDPTLCSKSMARIELTIRTSVFSWRETLHVLPFAAPYEHKSSESEFASALTLERDVSDTLQPQLLISLRFCPMRGANAISPCYSFSRVVVSEASLDNGGLLYFSLLRLILLKRVFHQQLDFTVFTVCSPEMVEFIQFGMLNDYWTEYFTKPTTDVFDDALDVALDHDVLDVAGQILREESAQILHLTNLLDCILSLSKLVVSINYTRNVDTPLGSQTEETNSRKCAAWVFAISVHRDKTSLLVLLANKEYIETKGYIAPKGYTKLLVSVISHVYNVEIVFFESLCLLNSLPVIGKIWSTVMLVGNAVRELSILASNLLLVVGIASSIAPMRLITMISILYYSNLEDKVLIGAEGIVMNGPRPLLAKKPNTRLSGYVWDPD